MISGPVPDAEKPVSRLASLGLEYDWHCIGEFHDVQSACKQDHSATGRIHDCNRFVVHRDYSLGNDLSTERYRTLDPRCRYADITSGCRKPGARLALHRLVLKRQSTGPPRRKCLRQESIHDVIACSFTGHPAQYSIYRGLNSAPSRETLTADADIGTPPPKIMGTSTATPKL